MKILVTGSSGSLGKLIVSELDSRGYSVISYSRSMSLDLVSWSEVNTIINCASVIPGKDLGINDYLDGNIVFLQKLLKFSKNKKFIHFSSFSELYKNDFYQKTKMLANSILMINAHLFSDLKILPLPTLNDYQLIESIVRLANDGSNPKVDQLKYFYMSYADVAKYVVDYISLPAGSVNPISSLYKCKDLYQEVTKKIDSNKVIQGKEVQRTLYSDDVYCIPSDLIASLVS
jgi:hypothetical protein